MLWLVYLTSWQMFVALLIYLFMLGTEPWALFTVMQVLQPSNSRSPDIIYCHLHLPRRDPGKQISQKIKPRHRQYLLLLGLIPKGQ